MKRKKWKSGIILSVLLLLMVGVPVKAVEKQTIFNSPYVTFSPDGRAWTTNAGEKNYTQYPQGTTVSTGIASTIRELSTGEHYYKKDRNGEVPVGYWKVEHAPAQCIHSRYPIEEQYHGVDFNRQICGGFYYSGWMAYCADCGDKITDMYVYMSKSAAQSIDYLHTRGNNGVSLSYYYLCPHCTNLEQGKEMKAHFCNSVSANKYKIAYKANTQTYGGYMADSFHMYNNATEYEGEPVTPVTRLTKNSYTRTGYEFAGWNTEPDGTGTAYKDGAEIRNLTPYNKDEENEKGTITLFAQWRPSQSTLRIDPNGGSYGGSAGVTELKKDYDSKYVLSVETIMAPTGKRVVFETNGGAEIAPVTGNMHFLEWKMEQPFSGRIKNDVYYFIAPDGNVDTLTALYEPDPVVLPEVTRAGYSFGGWYFDSGFTQPAGGAGDSITPVKDTTLYAQWVDLRLTAKDNYTANDKKGAVDLSWKQSDGNNKTYRIYQSQDSSTWTRINDATDISNSRIVAEDFAFTGKTGTYTVPYAGLYVLTAYGAQGGNYGSYAGGSGGKVEAAFWLSKGEVLTYIVGSSAGYNGGGAASNYGAGGGMTTMKSNLKGTLLIAGGGGGASPAGNGGAGGSSASVISGNNGQSGMAGGGAGYQGGKAGERIVHSHSNSCYTKVGGTEKPAAFFYELGESTAGYSSYHTPTSSSTVTFAEAGAHTIGDRGVVTFTAGNTGTYVATPYAGNGKLTYSISANSWGPSSTKCDMTTVVYFIRDNGTVYSQSYTPTAITPVKTGENAVLVAKGQYQITTYYSCTSTYYNGTIIDTAKKDWYDGSHHGLPANYTATGTMTIPIPAGVKGVYIALTTYATGNVHYSQKLSNVSYAYSSTLLTCGYQQGQVISSRPAYGGSNYVNTSHAYGYTNTAGQQKGNGAISLRSEAIGYVEGLKLDAVTATDKAAPDSVAKSGVVLEQESQSTVRVSWEAPKDYGTDYYHMVESFLVGATNPLCQSNVTKNTLTSGIKGYYVVADGTENTEVSSTNGSFQTARQFTVSGLGQPGTKQYLHLAAVDVAGNKSSTIHLSLGEEDVAWDLYTRSLTIEEGENVYPAPGEKSYYVRSDGETPFLLELTGYMDGPATKDYQINYSIYETVTEGAIARNKIETPGTALQNGVVRTDAKDLIYSTEELPVLSLYPYSITERSNRNCDLRSVQKFFLKQELSGKSIEVIPIVGANRGVEVVYSDHEKDCANKITLIADGEAPTIRGLEIMESNTLINRTEGEIHLEISATDDLSGVKNFYVEIQNTDNASLQEYLPDADGVVRIKITEEEPIFSGDFFVTAYAVDNVGNVQEVKHGTTEFALTATVERILEPHEPIFKAGESGILTITTWGYADRVEVVFPEEMTVLAPEINKTFHYTDTPSYVQTETVQFMIPLYAPQNDDFEITVKAYKGDKKLEDYPTFSTISVNGSVLSEIRTRLR